MTKATAQHLSVAPLAALDNDELRVGRSLVVRPLGWVVILIDESSQRASGGLSTWEAGDPLLFGDS